MQPEMQSSQLEPTASARLSHAGRIFTSDLSVNEFALLHGAGFEPVELVMGVSVYHVGFQFTGLKRQAEMQVLTEATYRARWNAMSRMQAEADAVQADGVVGVRLQWRHQNAESAHLEFIAVGTAPLCAIPPSRAGSGGPMVRPSPAICPART
jgi:uncharacterized protein YbjQ (UPF0145 family)